MSSYDTSPIIIEDALPPSYGGERLTGRYGMVSLVGASLRSEAGVRDAIAKLTAWLDAPRLAARATAEVVASDAVFDDDPMNDPITTVTLLRTTFGEWGVRCTEPGKVDEDWFTAERDGRGHFADLRGKALCICGAEVDENEIDRSGDEPQCPKCVAEAVAAFKAQPMRCAEGDHPCGWEGTGAGVGVVEGDNTPCCPDCGGDVEEVRDV